MDVAFGDEPGRWFGVIDLDESTPRTALSVLHELLAMLDTLQPELIDPSRSTIRGEGHGWGVDESVEVKLMHLSDEEAAVTVVVGKKGAIVSWLSAHEHIWPGDGSTERPWTTLVVDAVAAVLRGEYEVENHHRGRHLVKTRVIDVAHPSHKRIVSTTGLLVLSWLPWPGRKQVERQRVNYGTGPS